MIKNSFLTLLTAFILTACSPLQAGSLQAVSSQTPGKVVTVNPPASENPVQTVPATRLPPTVLPVPSIPATEQPILLDTPVSAVAQPVFQKTSNSSTGKQMVKIFFIAVDDNGQSGEMVGCGDSVVAVQVPIPHTQGVLKAALEALLSIKDQYYGQSGLYNALFQSDLHLKSVAIESGKAIIKLTGTLKLGGVCDDPRVLAQIKSTALQFSTVNDVVIFLNDKPIEEVLSEKG